MNITIVTPHRNAERYLNKYMKSIDALRLALDERGDRLFVLIGIGDSTDRTNKILSVWALPLPWVQFVDCTHGGPVYGSIVDAGRFRHLAQVMNTLWSELPDDADVVVVLDGEIVFDTGTMLALIDHTSIHPAIAPMVWTKHPNRFYDTWGFRRNGERFTEYPPHHPGIGNELLQIDSAGSCVAMQGNVARSVFWPDDDVIVGVCRQINDEGGSIWLDPSLSVEHL